jgi:phospholipid transport system substrate-binding protein
MGTRKTLRFAAIVGVALALLLAAPAGAKGKRADAAGLAEARAAVAVAMEQVLAALSDDALSSAERRAKIEKIAYGNFDFATMSKLVLRRDWKKFSEAQRSEFVDEFKLHLAESYGSRLERYDQQEIEIAGERAEARGDVTVHTVIVGGQFDGAQVDYRMRKQAEGWLAIDVVIEGVSLVSNFHSQFAEIVGREGPEGLLKQLRDKNAMPAASS